MLYIILFISIVALSAYGYYSIKRKEESFFDALFFGVLLMGLLMLVVVLFAIPACLVTYNEIYTTTKGKIEIAENYNEEVLQQITPIIAQYLAYESETFKCLKPDTNTIIGMSQYPELKGNEFLQKQIELIIENQKKIRELKEEYASLDVYRLWIWKGADDERVINESALIKEK